MWEQYYIVAVLFCTLALFIWGKVRYDIVALLAMLAVGISGIIPGHRLFDGFGHPAVITVAAVLVVSRALLNSGLVDILARWLSKTGNRPLSQVVSLTGFAAMSSGFINNVGALALLMPVAIRMARKSGNAPSLLLMPLAFGSLLGGLITLIGTPPNIIISAFRADITGTPFRMFDFTPVGLGVALAGVSFIALIGWRLIPQRRSPTASDELFDIDAYITEVIVPEKSRMIGKRLRELEAAVETEIVVVGLIRGKERYAAPSLARVLRQDDILIIKADTEDLQELLEVTGLKLGADQKPEEQALRSEQVALAEAVITPGSPVVGRTAQSLKLRERFDTNLLAVARQGDRLRARPGRIRLQAGDVLLLQGGVNTLPEILPQLGCLPLAERGLRLGQPRRAAFAVGIFGIALGTAAAGLLPVQVAFTATAVAMVLVGLITLREAYESIDWSVIILLGAMIPVSQALESSGTAALAAEAMLDVVGPLSPWISVALILIVTMFLSDLVNNAAAALLMAPIAVGVAHGLGASIDPFLISVAVGASCAFLTPIGHQSNTLVMGPGGYRFGDYWRMGLPLELVIIIVAVPLIMLFWPPVM